MLFLKAIGAVWAFPLGTLRGLTLMLIPWWGGVWFPYLPRHIRLGKNGFEIVVGRLIPAGFDRTGDGDIDDPDDFRTGGQTHGQLRFFRDEYQLARPVLMSHEGRHTVQEMVFGPFYPLIYGVTFLWHLARLRDVAAAYLAVPFEVDARKFAGEQL